MGYGSVVVKNKGDYKIVKVKGSLLPFTERSMIGPIEKEYANVMLFRYGRKWYLRYDENHCTGHFKSRREAAKWFNTSGR